MAEADLDRRKPSMAGTAPAVAYFWKSSRTVAQYEPQPKRVGTPRLFVIHEERRKPTMADTDTIFVLSKEDVVDCAREMGIPEEAITDDILAQVKKGVEWGLECWSDVVKEAINMALKS
ncbi:MAG: hypothetical protein PHQ43_10955 [Dehalococcoidales bacterium]|nr:hypothetical protein [Dehalococcoidales bacterium]